VPRIWPKADVVLIGGGPSFAQVDRGVLRDLSLWQCIRVIGVNKAYKIIEDSGEWIHAIFFGDDRFYKVFRRLPDGIYSFPGLRVGCNPASDRDKAVKFLGRDRKHGHGITDNPTLVCWNKNSGGAAINFAYHLTGPGSRCFLFGYDMAPDEKNGKAHWHDGYSELNPKVTRKDPVKAPYDRWLGTFPAIARDAKRLDFHIFNVSPASQIQEFPKITFDEFVKIVDRRKTEENI
jgi:hypothetical protein